MNFFHAKKHLASNIKTYFNVGSAFYARHFWINFPDTASHNICIFSLGHASQSRKVIIAHNGDYSTGVLTMSGSDTGLIRKVITNEVLDMKHIPVWIWSSVCLLEIYIFCHTISSLWQSHGSWLKSCKSSVSLVLPSLNKAASSIDIHIESPRPNVQLKSEVQAVHKKFSFWVRPFCPVLKSQVVHEKFSLEENSNPWQILLWEGERG